MNIPFEHTFSGTAATPATLKPFDNTDNDLFAAIVSAGEADDIPGVYGLVIPTASFWLDEFSLSASGSAKVELGVLTVSGSVFVPLITVNLVAGVPLVRRFMHEGPLFNHNGSTKLMAIRITPAATATITVSGDLGCHTR